jgi:enamine deaminase RidA (YjgF/YER057c/UK114 family)
MTEDERPTEAPRISPFRTVGGITYLYGHVAVDAQRRPIEGSFLEEARRVFECVGETLGRAGGSMADVVSVRAYLVDFAHFADFNQVWNENFFENPPVRTTVRAGLIEPFRIELEVIAAISEPVT